VLKKAPRKNVEVKDVPADDPVGTMDRFTDGLRQVLSSPKHKQRIKPQRGRIKR